MTREDYIYTSVPSPHQHRAQEMLKKYPHIKNLFGHYRPSFFYMAAMILAQFFFAYLVKDWHWVGLIVLAYLVGAVLNHGLFAALHEVTHNLVFKTPFMNKVLGLGLNLPQLFPASAAFRHYHLIHHSNFSEYDYDADIAHHWEARLIQNSPWRKAIWYSLFLVVEALRPLRLKNTIFDRWVVANVILIVVADVLIWQFLGFKAFCYLGLSTIFGLGLHPVGARWIQEHYLFDLDPKQTTPPAQETFSYYGALNLLSYNVGYHVEHHDFFRVPWIHLPKLKKIAPEYYLGLKSYRSWTLLLWRFLFDRNVNLFSRVVR